MQREVPEIAQELRGLLTQVKGVQKVSEELTLSYIVVIEGEDDRAGVEQVGTVLAEQAKKYGFDLEVIPVTTEEVETAKQKMAEFASQS